jgi:hypothetical protein|tara:strand:- start:290 stop:844 length:555 start_codon:yes stop_codon:yes gene_type:complete
MTRLINSATLAALESDSFNIATLVQIDFSSVLRITDWGRSVSVLSNTWNSSANFIGIGDVTESAELRVNDLSLTLSGVEQTYVSIFLSNNYIDVPIKIYRAILNDADALVGDAILIFDGILTGYQIEDDDIGSKVTVQMASHWKDFEKENGRRTNHNSQQLYFSGDEGFEFAPKSIKDLKWGRK